MTWPVVDLDRVARLRVLSHALRGVVVEERTIAAPFDVVWSFVSDLPSSVPQFDRDVGAIEILERDGDRLTVTSRPPRIPIHVKFDVELAEGWCWMVSRPQMYVVGMAAVAAGDHTRFALLEGVALVGPEWSQPLLRPVNALSAWRHRRHLPRDVDGIERALGLRS